MYFQTSVPSSKSSGDLVDLFDGTSQSAGELPHCFFIFRNLGFRVIF